MAATPAPTARAATAGRLVRDARTDPATGPRPHALILTGDQARTDGGAALLLALGRAPAGKWGIAHDPLPGGSTPNHPLMCSNTARHHAVRRTCLAVNPSTCSANVHTTHSLVSQKNRRTCSRNTTGW